MRKGVYGRQLGRNKNQRTALFKGLVCRLIENGRIETTLAKAKSVKPLAEKLITRAKKGRLFDRRLIFRVLNSRQLVNRLVDGIVPALRERNSGYLRIIKLGARKGDLAMMAQLSFADEIAVIEKPSKQAIAESPKVGEKQTQKHD